MDKLRFRHTDDGMTGSNEFSKALFELDRLRTPADPATVDRVTESLLFGIAKRGTEQSDTVFHIKPQIRRL